MEYLGQHQPTFMTGLDDGAGSDRLLPCMTLYPGNCRGFYSEDDPDWYFWLKQDDESG